MKYLLYILIFLTPLCSWTQNERDSLVLLLRNAEEFANDKNYSEAQLRATEVYALAMEKDMDDEIISSLLLLARIASLQNKPESTLKYRLDILDYNMKNGDIPSIYEALLELAHLYQKQEIFSKAIEYYNRALSYINTKDEYNIKPILWEELAEIHARHEQYDSSRYYREFLIENSISNNDWDVQLYHQQKMADTWSTQENHDQSIQIYNTIISLSQQNNDSKNTAIAYNNLGIAHTKKKDYKSALEALREAEEICNEKPLVDLAVLFSNMGIAYHNLDNPKKSIEYLLLSINYAKGEEKYALHHTLAKIYLDNEDYYNAASQNDVTLNNTKNERLKSQSLKTAADIKEELYDYEAALDFKQEHLELEQQFSIADNLERQKLLELKTKLERSEKEISLELAAQTLEENKIKAEKEKLDFENRQLQLEKEKTRLENEKNQQRIALLSQQQKAKEAEIHAQQAELKNKELETASQQQQLALTQQKLEAERAARDLEESQQQQELQQMELEAAQEREQRKQMELEASQKEKEAQTLLLEQEKTLTQVIRSGAIIGGIVSAFIIGLVLWFLRVSNRKNKKLAQQNDEIEKQRAELEESRDLIALEQKKSEDLLLNILPGAIANELKEKGYATPKEYELVTVLFTDFGGFTKVSAQMDADDLIEELNTCFRTFDEIIEKYNIQPIKTIGDSYMCAGGVPIEGSVPPSDMVRAAIEINQFMVQRQAEKQAAGIDYWATRIGIHSGPVIAGVVGKKKFAYDIWGDAVNTASRMESYAELNSINISDSTYQLVKKDFNCTYRGEFEVKNKGIMKMYKVGLGR